ncbi:MAG: cobalt-precorrin-5B (C(1))-methyltransferase CbiD [Thermoleophilia bacterium]
MAKPVNTSRLIRGYTTGACAQAATRGAALTVATGYVPCEKGKGGKPLGDREKTGSVKITLPNGEIATFLVTMHAEGVCSVIKDAGDDPDITNGVRIIACVTAALDGRFPVDGAEGVGRVTLPGLAVKTGRAAINPVPLKYIRKEARRVLPRGAEVVISIPAGEELARKTFNPRLGILGGLSILGTTGRVEPWSSVAYQESLLPQLDVALAAGVRRPVLVPGAKGERAALGAGFKPGAIVHAGNYFGMMLAAAKERGFKRVTLVGHAAKLAKIARGDFDTHSRHSAMPLDVLAASATAMGLSARRVAAMRLLPTTEAAIRRLQRTHDLQVLDDVAGRVAAAVRREYHIQADIVLTDGGGRVVGRA